MESYATASPVLPVDARLGEGYGAHHSGVSWGAVFAGAAGATALSLILAVLGFGLGMSSISPWAGQGASAGTLSIASIAWITLTQIAAAALGGYLAGRLRIKWANVHNDEVYFRDTAHGFLAWAVGTLLMAALFTSTLGMIASGGAKVGATALAGVGTAATAVATQAADGDNGMGYSIDRLFRGTTPAPAAADAAPATDDANAPATANTSSRGMDRSGGRGEAMRIFANATRTGTLSDADVQYLGQQIAARTGISQQEAEARVRTAYADLGKAIDEAKQAADKARKAAAYLALWLFVSLLGGAFVASFTATYGGKRRDHIA